MENRTELDKLKSQVNALELSSLVLLNEIKGLKTTNAELQQNISRVWDEILTNK
ncbi:MAG: hypothetical protein ACRCX8_18880 [Sarcina sp.]